MSDLETMLAGRELLIFDFDGTIAGTSPLHARAFAEVLAPHGVAMDYPAIAGMRTEAALTTLFAAAGRDLPLKMLHDLTAQKRMRARTLIERGIVALPGVDSFLRFARAGWKLALVSSGSRGSVELALGKLGYPDWFDPAIFAEDVIKAKPSSEGFRKAAALAGVPAQHCLVFEDSAAGFAAARAAGMDYVDAPIAIPAWAQLSATL